MSHLEDSERGRIAEEGSATGGQPGSSSRSIAVFISGGGTTLKNLIDFQQQELSCGRAPFSIALVISSRSDAGGLKYAADAGVPARSIAFGATRESMQEGSRLAFEACRAAGVQWVVLGGFLKHLEIPPDFSERVVNIHPSLIPAFSGHGYYGLRVHRAVLDYGCHVSGCTVHFVDNEYDRGPIIAQSVVPVEPEDSPESLQQRVFRQECQLYPRVVSALVQGKYVRRERTVRLL